MNARAILAIILLMPACTSTPAVNTQFDQAADFSRYRTYSWMDKDVAAGSNQLVYQRVRSSIESWLGAHGFSQAPPGDFTMMFTISAHDRMDRDYGEFQPFYSGRGTPYNFGRGPGQLGAPRSVRNGVLSIEVYDTASKKPVWQGVTSREIPSTGADQRMIDDAVNTVLSKFPAKPAGS